MYAAIQSALVDNRVPRIARSEENLYLWLDESSFSGHIRACHAFALGTAGMTARLIARSL
jgi:hypothetical protein